MTDIATTITGTHIIVVAGRYRATFPRCYCERAGCPKGHDCAPFRAGGKIHDSHAKLNLCHPIVGEWHIEAVDAIVAKLTGLPRVRRPSTYDILRRVAGHRSLPPWPDRWLTDIEFYRVAS